MIFIKSFTCNNLLAGKSHLNKERQIQMLTYHLSYSYCLTHIMVSMFAVSQIIGFNIHTRNDPFIKVCYYASVWLNSTVACFIFWVFHNKYKQTLLIYAFKSKVKVCIAVGYTLQKLGIKRGSNA